MVCMVCMYVMLCNGMYGMQCNVMVCNGMYGMHVCNVKVCMVCMYVMLCNGM